MKVRIIFGVLDRRTEPYEIGVRVLLGNVRDLPEFGSYTDDHIGFSCSFHHLRLVPLILAFDIADVHAVFRKILTAFICRVAESLVPCL